MRLNIIEVARRLELPPGTVERWIRQGRIPIQKIGHDCIFEAAALEKWARNHHLCFTITDGNPDKKTEETGAGDHDSLLSAMKRGQVFYHITGEGVQAVLTAAVEKLPDLSHPKKTILLEKLLEREHLTSTGIGNGIAMPHPRTQPSDIVVEPMVSTFFLAQPVDYNAIDDQPVSVLFLLLSPNVKSHLHLLSRLSFCVRDDAFVSFLKSVPDRDPFFRKVADFEEKLDKAEYGRSQ